MSWSGDWDLFEERVGMAVSTSRIRHRGSLCMPE